MTNSKTSFVLVHGAWAECASWNNIILPLKERGSGVVCAPLPLTSLPDDVNALDRVLARIYGDIILVGHAYSGAVIAATKNQKVKSLIYVAALAPDEGETVADLFYKEEPHIEAPKLAPDDQGFIWMPSEGFDRAFAQDADTQTKALLLATQRPIHVKCIQEKVSRPLWKYKPSWFLIAENDRMISAKTQHFQAKRMGAIIRTHAVDHSPMITAPNLVLDILLESHAALKEVQQVHS